MQNLKALHSTIRNFSSKSDAMRTFGKTDWCAHDENHMWDHRIFYSIMKVVVLQKKLCWARHDFGLAGSWLVWKNSPNSWDKVKGTDTSADCQLGHLLVQQQHYNTLNSNNKRGRKPTMGWGGVSRTMRQSVKMACLYQHACRMFISLWPHFS